jgi:carboxylate-amine ligase
MRTFGVEEELLLVDERTGTPVAAAPRILEWQSGGDAPSLEAEIQQEMLEVVGPPCATVHELAEGIAQGRRRADTSAQAVGARAVPLATSPLPVTPHHSPTARYAEMMRRYGITARRTLTCGFHVHVSVETPEEGVAALDRIREWLPTILALSANSPFWEGADTGYASYRNDVWSRWPSAGPNPVFGSEAQYREHERALLATGTLLDAGMLYFDARLSRNHPTVEIRIADICLREEDAVTIAALCRGLVETAVGEWRRGIAPRGADQRLLRLATWRVAMTGMRGDHVEPLTGAPCSPEAAVTALLDHAEPGLDRTGDGDRVARGVLAILERGTGADWQRQQLSRRGRIDDVVRSVWASEQSTVSA